MSRSPLPNGVLPTRRYDSSPARRRPIDTEGTAGSFLRPQHRELLRFHEWCSVAFTSLVSLLRNDAHETSKLKISTGASWTFLADEDLVVQTDLDIREYTDTHHTASVPYTLVLAPGLIVDKIYCGYWFLGSPAGLRRVGRPARPQSADPC